LATWLWLQLQALPESLRYLLAAGQNEKAADVVRRLAASNGKELPRGQLTTSAEVSIYRFPPVLYYEINLP